MIQRRSVVIVTAVRVTIGYDDTFLLPKKDFPILKIFEYCASQL